MNEENIRKAIETGELEPAKGKVPQRPKTQDEKRADDIIRTLKPKLRKLR